MPSKTTTAKPAASTGRPHPDSPEAIFRSLIKRHLISTLARHEGSATPRDWCDTIHYLSLEYLMGRLLENNLRNSGLYDTAKAALADMGKDLDTLRAKPNRTWASAMAASAVSRPASWIQPQHHESARHRLRHPL
jgi:hypothetical protein